MINLPPTEENPIDSPLRLHLIKSTRMPDQIETTLVLNLENQSTAATYEVDAKVANDNFSDYSLESWRSPIRLLGKLSSGEKRTLEFTVLPKSPQDPYLDVKIDISYEQLWKKKYVRFIIKVPLTTEIGEGVSFKNPYIPL